MTEPTTERLYNLLPAIYRVRDAEQAEPLRALLGVLENELLTLHDDIDALYDDWFIETCAEWVVPYIGDLVGVRGLLPATTGGAFSQRARVADALAVRRAKGTGAALEQLARDVTGWPARAVEFFELLATAQHVNHVRASRPASVDLHHVDSLELLGGPFEQAAHTPNVRRVSSVRGKYNIPSVGIFLWRLQSYAMAGSTARALPATRPEELGRFTFSALGLDGPLFNLSRTADSALEQTVPGPLRRRPLHDELDARRQSLSAGARPAEAYFAVDPVLQLQIRATPDGPLESVLPEEIVICDLSDTDQPERWRRPPGQIGSQRIRAAVDPALGRIATPSGVVPQRVEVGYAYGFSADLGGGPYNRRDSVAAWISPPAPAAFDQVFQVGVTQDATARAGDVSGQLVGTLREAIGRWNAQAPRTLGVIAIMDNRSYVETLTGTAEIVVPADSRLLIVSADWPREIGASSAARLVGRLAATGRRAHLLGDVAIRGSAAADAIAPGRVCLNGLLVEGNVLVEPGNLAELRIAHTTLAPMACTLSVAANARLDVMLERSIVGAVRLDAAVRGLRIVDTIVDGTFAGGAALVSTATGIDASTVLGTTVSDTLDASNSLFSGSLAVRQRQSGCVRFSYVPPGSLAPRRFQCQPATGAGTPSISVRPRFTSQTFGQPGYAQLAPTCPTEISAGADDEGEMGAFHFLQQTQRIGSLQASLDEHLRFGLEAGVFLVT